MSHLHRIATAIDRRPGALGLAAAVVVLAVSWLVFVHGVGGRGGTIVRAAFVTDRAGDGAARLVADSAIIPGSPVRVNGVDVGAVDGVDRAEDGPGSIVRLRVHDVDVHIDARVRIVWRTLLGGNMAVELDPGSASAPPLEDATIPPSRTRSQVEFDDLFDVFGPATRAHQQQLLKGFSQAVSGPGAGTALETAARAATPIEAGLRPLNGVAGHRDLAALTASGARVTRALGRSPGQLQALLSGAATTLAVTARRRQDLGTTIGLTPSTLDATVRAVHRLESMLDRLDPLVAHLRPAARGLGPAARALTPALRQTARLLREATPLLREVGPTFRSLRRAARHGSPLMRELAPTLERLDKTLIPFLESRDTVTKLRVADTIGPAFAVADSAGSQFDENGFFFVFPNSGDERAIGALPCAPDLSGPVKLGCSGLKQVIDAMIRANDKVRR